MKGHIGTDSKTKLIHTVVTTAANVHDRHVLGDLLQGAKTRAWGDSAYTRHHELMPSRALAAPVFTCRKGSRHRRLTGAQRIGNRTGNT